LEYDYQKSNQNLKLSNEMRHYYDDADRHAFQSNGNLVEISNLSQVTSFLPFNFTSTPFKELVTHNALLKSKLEKMIAIVKSF